jgi:hypothetical protein
MYFPFFRGQQQELLAISDTAGILAANGNVFPVIEPVHDKVNRLAACATVCGQAGLSLGLVINPQCGELKGQQAHVEGVLLPTMRAAPCDVRPFFALNASTTPRAVAAFLAAHQGEVGFVHFEDPNNAAAILAALGTASARSVHIVLDQVCSVAYVAAVAGKQRVVLRDGFRRQERNADYPNAQSEVFHDLHAMFARLGFDGFGDFLTVGAKFIDKKGGPGLAIALHATAGTQNRIDCYHFVSTSNNSPANPRGKYREALTRLDAFVQANPGRLYSSSGLRSFLDDHTNGENTSRAIMKRRSMKHHLELMCTLV